MGSPSATAQDIVFGDTKKLQSSAVDAIKTIPEAQQSTAKQERIKQQVEADINQRKKKPGKAQTLLTNSLVPNGENTNTLLTISGKL